jgi:hypothetical protein
MLEKTQYPRRTDSTPDKTGQIEPLKELAAKQ